MKSFSCRNFKAILEVQRLEFFRDKGGLFLSIVFPVFFAISLIVTNNMERSFTLEFGVVNTHSNTQAQVFVDALTSNMGIEAKTVELDSAKKELQEGTLDAIVILPQGEFIKGEKEVELIVSPRYEEFVNLIFEAVRARILEKTGENPKANLQYNISPPDGEVRSEFLFTFPGILALALLQLAMFGTAAPIMQAKERGTLKYLLLTPLKISELLCAQLTIRLGAALIQVGILLAVGMNILDLGVGHWLAVIGVAILGAIMLISIGYAIAGIATNLQVGMAMVLLANFSMAFLGNVFWDPASSDFTLYLSYIIPLTYLSDMFRQVITGVQGLHPLWLDALVIVGFSLVAILFASKTFKFDNQYNNN
jgi:ABC-2 type transport system permease protein